MCNKLCCPKNSDVADWFMIGTIVSILGCLAQFVYAGLYDEPILYLSGIASFGVPCLSHTWYRHYSKKSPDAPYE